jgi:hypothetical protein
MIKIDNDMLRKSQLLLLMVPLLSALSITFLHAQQIQSNPWVPNGPVNTIARQGDIMYVGGQFTEVGRTIAKGAVLNAATGQPRLNDELFTGNVYHSVTDGQGGFFLSGDFAATSGTNRRFVLHQLSNGEFSTSFNPVFTGHTQIKVLAATVDRVLIRSRLVNSNLYTLYCMAYDGSIYWSRQTNGRIHEAIQSEGSIIVVGNFLSVEGQARTRAAAFSIYSGELLPWNTGTSITIINEAVSSLNTSKSVTLGIHQNELFIRWVAPLNPNPNTILASFDLQSGTPTGWSIPLHTNVSSPMLVHHGRVYIGTSSGEGLLVLNAVTKEVLPNPVDISILSPNLSANRIDAIGALGNTIYLAGGNKVNPNGAVLADLVAFNETTLQKEGLEANIFRNYSTVQGSIFTISSGSDNIFVGGTFTSIMVQPRTNLFAYNVVTGELLPFNAQFSEDGVVTQLFSTDSRLYVSGFFVEVNGQERFSGLASFNLADGSLNDWNPDLGGHWGTVYGYGEQIYIYGGFTSVNGNARSGLAALWSCNGCKRTRRICSRTNC